MSDDLERARHLRELDQKLGHAAPSVDPERTHRYLEGLRMTNEAQLVVRVPEAMLDRLDDLAARWPLSDDDVAMGRTMTRSAITRLALLRGVAALEAEAKGQRRKR